MKKNNLNPATFRPRAFVSQLFLAILASHLLVGCSGNKSSNSEGPQLGSRIVSGYLSTGRSSSATANSLGSDRNLLSPLPQTVASAHGRVLDSNNNPCTGDVPFAAVPNRANYFQYTLPDGVECLGPQSLDFIGLSLDTNGTLTPITINQSVSLNQSLVLFRGNSVTGYSVIYYDIRPEAFDQTFYLRDSGGISEEFGGSVCGWLTSTPQHISLDIPTTPNLPMPIASDLQLMTYGTNSLVPISLVGVTGDYASGAYKVEIAAPSAGKYILNYNMPGQTLPCKYTFEIAESCPEGTLYNPFNESCEAIERPAVASYLINGDSYDLIYVEENYSIVKNITLDFTQPVYLELGAVTITPKLHVTAQGGVNPSQEAVTVTFSPVDDYFNTRYLLTFSGPGTHDGGILSNGVYDLQVTGSKVHTRPDYAQYPEGDITMDGIYISPHPIIALFGAHCSLIPGPESITGCYVDGRSFSGFVSTFNSELYTPRYDIRYDYDLDGFIDGTDFSAFVQTFNADWAF